MPRAAVICHVVGRVVAHRHGDEIKVLATKALVGLDHLRHLRDARGTARGPEVHQVDLATQLPRTQRTPGEQGKCRARCTRAVGQEKIGRCHSHGHHHGAGSRPANWDTHGNTSIGFRPGASGRGAPGVPGHRQSGWAQGPNAMFGKRRLRPWGDDRVCRCAPPAANVQRVGASSRAARGRPEPSGRARRPA